MYTIIIIVTLKVQHHVPKKTMPVSFVLTKQNLHLPLGAQDLYPPMPFISTLFPLEDKKKRKKVSLTDPFIRMKVLSKLVSVCWRFPRHGKQRLQNESSRHGHSEHKHEERVLCFGMG